LSLCPENVGSPKHEVLTYVRPKGRYVFDTNR